MTASSPPRLTEWFVRRSVARSRRDDVLGDLREDFVARCGTHGVARARRWYRRQAVAYAAMGAGGVAVAAWRGTTGFLRSLFAGGAPALVHDLRYAARSLARTPVFTGAALGSLALGIGANTAFFSLFDSVVLHPLPVEEPERVVSVYLSAGDERFSRFSYADYVDYRRDTEVFAALAAWFQGEFAVGSDGETEIVEGELVSDNYFDALAVRPVQGRGFLPEEGETPGTHPVVVVSHAFWQTRLGGVRDVVGRSLAINGHRFEVVGVAPPGFSGPNVAAASQVWVPLMMYDAVATGFFANFRAVDYEEVRTRGNRIGLFRLIGRLAEGVSLERARANVAAVGERLASEHASLRDRVPYVEPARLGALPPSDRNGLLTFVGVSIASVGLVLLLACANLANLLLARADRRQREVAIRVALGASRVRLLRQWLTESMLLSVLAGAVGLVVAAAVLGALAPFSLPGGVAVGAHGLSLNPVVLLFSLGLSLVTGVVYGLVPAIYASRIEVVQAIKNAPRGSVSGGAFSLRHALVAAQLAVSLVLLSSAGLFIRSMVNALRSDLGFDPDNLAVVTLDFGAAQYDHRRAWQFYLDFRERAAAVPAVVSIGATDAPFGTSTLSVSSIQVGGREEPVEVGNVEIVHVDDAYFSTSGMRLEEGRRVSIAGGERVAVVNRSLARLVWPEGDALGGRIFGAADRPGIEVVGIAADVRLVSVTEAEVPIVYLPIEPGPDAMSGGSGGMTDWPVAFAVRTAADAGPLVAELRAIVRALDPAVPVVGATTMTERVARTLMVQRMGLRLLAGVSGVALLVAALGVYGTVSFALSRRVTEFGIRAALGCGRARLLALVVRQGMIPVIVGAAGGIVATLAAGRFLEAFLVSVAPSDPTTLILGVLVLLAVSLIATVLPARTVTGSDPAAVLHAGD